MSSPRGLTARCGRRDAGPSCAALARTKRVRRQPLGERAAVFARSASNPDGATLTSRAPGPVACAGDDVQPVRVAASIELGDFMPEGIALDEKAHEMLLFSDDGSIDVDGKPCKRAVTDRRSFRGITLPLP